MRFIEKLLEQDFDLDKVSFPTNSEQQLKTLVSLREERRGYMEISDNPIQNTFYRLAKELYGYTGKNDLSDIMAFYSEDSG